MEEERLWLEAWRCGSADAARRLVERHYPRLLNLFYRLTGTREEAEELTQELFARLTRHIASGGEVQNLSAWLNRTAINLWRDFARREIAARRKGITYAGGDEQLERCRAPDEVEAAVTARADQAAVREAVLELAPYHREALVLHHYQGLSYAEVARVTGVPVGTVRSRIHYAVATLRRLLEAQTRGGDVPWQDRAMN